MRAKIISVFAVAFSVIVIGLLHAQFTGCVPAGTGLNSVVTNIAPWYCANVSPAVISIWTQWLPIMLIAISVAFSIAIVIFLFGIALRNDRLRTFGIGEMYEAFATTLIVGLFVFIAAVMFGLLPAITAGPIDPYDASLSYIASTINITSASMTNLFVVDTLAGFYQSIGFQVSTFGGEVKTPPVVGIATFAISYYFFWPTWTVIIFMVEALISLYTQFYLIIFIMYASIPVFLIPGILFRTFPPTRSLGGMMIAMSIGFYFVMPTLFSIAYFYTSNNIENQLALGNSEIARVGLNSNFVQSAGSAQAPLAIAVQTESSSFSSYWLSILFFPALIIAITYSLVTQIAEMIGGLSKSSSRLRMLV